MDRLVKFLATGFKSGLSPVAPGTAGTIVAAIILWLVLGTGLLTTVGFPLIFILVVGGTYITYQADALYEVEDAQEIVIDEIVGFVVAMANLTVNMLIPAFILFRFFDIYKPGPINKAQKFKGGLGIMLDDLVAGLAANVLLRIVLYFA